MLSKGASFRGLASPSAYLPVSLFLLSSWQLSSTPILPPHEPPSNSLQRSSSPVMPLAEQGAFLHLLKQDLSLHNLVMSKIKSGFYLYLFFKDYI